MTTKKAILSLIALLFLLLALHLNAQDFTSLKRHHAYQLLHEKELYREAFEAYTRLLETVSDRQSGEDLQNLIDASKKLASIKQVEVEPNETNEVIEELNYGLLPPAPNLEYKKNPSRDTGSGIDHDETVSATPGSKAGTRKNRSISPEEAWENIDALIESYVEIHAENASFIHAVGSIYFRHLPHDYLYRRENGRYIRPYNGGVVESCRKKDNLSAIYYYKKAWDLCMEQKSHELVVTLLEDLVEALSDPEEYFRGPTAYGKYKNLLKLSDLNQRNNWEIKDDQRFENFIPTDQQNRIITFKTPESWEKAANNGERVEFLFAEAKQFRSDNPAPVVLARAKWLFSSFSINALGDFVRHPYNRLDRDEIWHQYDIENLGDNETVVLTKEGLQKITLPEHYRFMDILGQVVNETETGVEAGIILIYEWLARMQFEKSAKLLDTLLGYRKYTLPFTTHRDQKELLLTLKENLTAPRARFLEDEFTPSFLPFNHAQPLVLPLSYRNAGSLNLSVQEINMEEVYQDAIRITPKQDEKETVENRKEREAFEKIMEGNLLTENFRYQDKSKIPGKYLTSPSVKQTINLIPTKNYKEQRKDLVLPISRPGVYLISVTLENGYKISKIIAVDNTRIVNKEHPEGQLLIAMDSNTGKPIANALIEGILRGDDDKIKSRFSGETDEKGMYLCKFSQKSFYMLARVVTADGTTYIPFNRLSREYEISKQDTHHHVDSHYSIMSQPVYRPGQTARMTAFMFKTNPIDPAKCSKAGQKWKVQIKDPSHKSHSLEQEYYTSNEYGAITLDFPIPANARLGYWSINVNGEQAENKGHNFTVNFRVEEYKKPEIEIEIVKPDKPVDLDRDVELVIKPRYLSGSLVTRGKVVINVDSSTVYDIWHPPVPEDWVNFTTRAAQYQKSWFHSRTSDLNRNVIQENPLDAGVFFTLRHEKNEEDGPGEWHHQSETILDQEIAFNMDDKNDAIRVKIPLKDFHAKNGDMEPQNLHVRVKLTDESLRETEAYESILASDTPYETFITTDQKFFESGKPGSITITTATINGIPVANRQIETSVFKLIKNNQGQIIPTNIALWQHETNREGTTRHSFTPAEPGNYCIQTRSTLGNGKIAVTQKNIYAYGHRQADMFTGDNVELILDKTAYLDGDTAKILISGGKNMHQAMLVIKYDNQREEYMHIPLHNGFAMMSLTVSEKNLPGVQLKAWCLTNGELDSDEQPLVIIPSRKQIDLTLETGKKTYRIREEGHVDIQVNDQTGKPVPGNTQIVLTIYDKALEQITPWRGGYIIPSIWRYRNLFPSYFSDSLYLETGKSFLPSNQEPMIPDKDLYCFMWTSNSEIPSVGAHFSAEMADMEMVAHPPMERGSQPEEQDTSITPTIRSNFADHVKWCGTLTTDEHGRVRVPMTMPDSLTTWKIRAWALTKDLRANETSAEFMTTQDLQVSLQAPRFFVETDNVMLSGIIRNLTDKPAKVQADLELDGSHLELLPESAGVREITIPARDQVRVDWMTKAITPGEAVIRLTAAGKEHGDSVEMKFPVLVHGAELVHSRSATLHTGQDKTELQINIPGERDPESTSISIQLSPSIALTMVEALPFLTQYPHGCIEQTLNKFLPASMIRNTMENYGIEIGSLRYKTENKKNPALDKNPVFDEQVLNEMIKKGISNIKERQLANGAWTWFQGMDKKGDALMTAIVFRGLSKMPKTYQHLLNDGTMTKAQKWLATYESARLKELIDENNSPNATDAFIRFTLGEKKHPNPGMLNLLLKERRTLPLYAKILLAQICHSENRVKDLKDLLAHIRQFEQRDENTGTTWLNRQNHWWYWYNHDVSIQSAYLRLLCAVEPHSQRTSKVAKWLAQNRINGTYWHSTKDTSEAIEALCCYLQATKEAIEPVKAEVTLNGKLLGNISMDAENMFTEEHCFTIPAKDIPSGTDSTQTIGINRANGKGNIYANVIVKYFSKQDPIPAAGNELQATRAYYLISEKGQKRTPLKQGDTVNSGDIIEVKIAITAKNDYEYLFIADPKPAGCESTENVSGYSWLGGFGAYQEIGDQSIRFYASSLPMGNHTITHRLRAERPGRFSALPATVEPMYNPGLKGNSSEMKITIGEKEKD